MIDSSTTPSPGLFSSKDYSMQIQQYILQKLTDQFGTDLPETLVPHLKHGIKNLQKVFTDDYLADLHPALIARLIACDSETTANIPDLVTRSLLDSHNTGHLRKVMDLIEGINQTTPTVH